MFNNFDMKSSIEQDIKFDRDQIELNKKHIDIVNKQLKETRKEDRDLVKYVWSVGVLEEIDMNIFTPKFKGSKTKQLEKERSEAQRNLKIYNKRLNKDLRLLEKYN